MEATETAEAARSNSALLLVNGEVDLAQEERHTRCEAFRDSYCRASMVTARSSENTYGRPMIPRWESIGRKAGYGGMASLNILPGYTDPHLPLSCLHR